MGQIVRHSPHMEQSSVSSILGFTFIGHTSRQLVQASMHSSASRFKAKTDLRPIAPSRRPVGQDVATRELLAHDEVENAEDPQAAHGKRDRP